MTGKTTSFYIDTYSRHIIDAVFKYCKKTNLDEKLLNRKIKTIGDIFKLGLELLRRYMREYPANGIKYETEPVSKKELREFSKKLDYL